MDYLDKFNTVYDKIFCKCAIKRFLKVQRFKRKKK